MNEMRANEPKVKKTTERRRKACEGLFERLKNKEDKKRMDADGWVGFR